MSGMTSTMPNQLAIRFLESDLDAIDEARRAERSPPSRAEMIRRLVREAIAARRGATSPPHSRAVVTVE